MKNILIYIILFFALFSCSSSQGDKNLFKKIDRIAIEHMNAVSSKGVKIQKLHKKHSTNFSKATYEYGFFILRSISERFSHGAGNYIDHLKDGSPVGSKFLTEKEFDEFLKELKKHRDNLSVEKFPEYKQEVTYLNKLVDKYFFDDSPLIDYEFIKTTPTSLILIDLCKIENYIYNVSERSLCENK